MRVRLQRKSKPNNYTESFAVNKADKWRERTCEYLVRSHGRVDRVTQQAIAQVLTPTYEPKFVETSYGFRP